MKIVDRLPYEAQDRVERAHFGDVAIFHHQIMIWVRLSVRDTLTLPFPAILDTGLNENLALNESHLTWLNLHIDQLRHIANVEISGRAVPLRQAEVYLQPNVRGTNVISSKTPYKLVVPEGIIVFPRAGGFPRLPLLGSRALTANGLRTIIDGRRRLVSIDTGRCFDTLRG